MPTLKDVCRYVRSKNAGPFWITVDLFFRDRESFDRYSENSALQADNIGRVFDVSPARIKRFSVPDLLVVKLSYPRPAPQGGMIERDMHGGQQYVRALNIELRAN
jgi:hypothetical protein